MQFCRRALALILVGAACLVILGCSKPSISGDWWGAGTVLKIDEEWIVNPDGSQTRYEITGDTSLKMWSGDTSTDARFALAGDELTLTLGDGTETHLVRAGSPEHQAKKAEWDADAPRRALIGKWEQRIDSGGIVTIKEFRADGTLIGSGSYYSPVDGSLSGTSDAVTSSWEIIPSTEPVSRIRITYSDESSGVYAYEIRGDTLFMSIRDGADAQSFAEEIAQQAAVGLGYMRQ